MPDASKEGFRLASDRARLSRCWSVRDATSEMPHVGWQAAPATLTDRVLPAVGVSGLWGKCPPKSPNSGRYASRKGRLEEGDQFLGDGFGFEQWGKVTDARQFSDVRVDDVLGHVAFHVGEEGAE
jgi:hypothetical protein